MKFNVLIYIIMFAAFCVGCTNGWQQGDFYKKNGSKGIVVAVDDAGNATLVLSLDECSNIDADSANRWAQGYDDGSWRLPSKDEMAQIKKYKSLINKTLQYKNEASVLTGHTFYWTSTPCSESHTYACGPDGVRCYFNTNASPHYRARAVKNIRTQASLPAK